jgi:hypothetical protein
MQCCAEFPSPAAGPLGSLFSALGGLKGAFSWLPLFSPWFSVFLVLLNKGLILFAAVAAFIPE